MAHKREEETELKLPSNPPLTCTPVKSPEPITKPAKSPDPSPDLPSRPRPRSGISQKFPADPANNKNIIKKITLNRCAGCRKKVGLTGFRCRCGELFCTEHRYSDRHECSYDYKAAGREAIARDNPVVRPAKLLKV